MPTFNVRVQKNYCLRHKPAAVQTVYGAMPVEAASLSEAVQKVEDLMRWRPDNHGGVATLQAADPRISWDEELDDDWEYEDFSFGVADDQGGD